MTIFTIHTPETAPEKSKDILKGMQSKLGYVPNVLAEMAESPSLLKAYIDIAGALKNGVFSETEKEVIQMTANMYNGCTYCLAAHTTLAEKAGVPRPVLDRLRVGEPLDDEKLEALRQFTKVMLVKEGWADKNDLETFFKAGYSKAAALEVILALSHKILTNYVNHIAHTPLDDAFKDDAVEVTEEGIEDKACCGGDCH